jgi:dihydrofolate synthase/folylpolyglutamate synthase
VLAELTPEAAAFTMADVEAALGSALRFGIHPSLEGIRALAEELGRPQDRYMVVQITGTNGKTSATRLTGALLAAHGWRTGIYTSPHLTSYVERVEMPGVGTVPVFAQAIGVAVTTARRAGLELTEFELLTGAALWLFAHLDAEAAVLEVGLGGRWDATSVTDPAVAVVTGVALDHTDRLGETVARIAADKARIIKPASVAVLGPGVGPDTAPVFLERAQALGVRARAVAPAGRWSPALEELTVRYGVIEPPHVPGGVVRFEVMGLHGEYPGLAMRAPSYQVPNAATAIGAAEAAIGGALDPRATRRALAEATFPGRFELVDPGPPPVVVDGAHNPQAAGVLADAIAEAWPDPDARPLVVLGMLDDKDAKGVVTALARVAGGFAVASPATPRALPAADLAAIVRAATGNAPAVTGSVPDAVRAGRAEATHGVVVTGSLYTAGEARPPVGDV